MIMYFVLQVTENQKKDWDINPKFTGAQFNDILPADGHWSCQSEHSPS